MSPIFKNPFPRLRQSLTDPPHADASNTYYNEDAWCEREHEWMQLATYNQQVSQGLVHTEEWRRKMARLQNEYDRDVLGIEDR